ncbi:hypothetical protein ARMSODRAFT_672120 [Armillaria solidipes]|uniref:Uncharacterized protein n=1 Tax=Armillaria solidipes TaxID=1076256 RepID=A0A2H3B9E3_9AGAR|nr:hypothetical protein ARMSODRAFT_672120 [Armillaria solidipes]
MLLQISNSVVTRRLQGWKGQIRLQQKPVLCPLVALAGRVSSFLPRLHRRHSFCHVSVWQYKELGNESRLSSSIRVSYCTLSSQDRDRLQL